MTCSVTERKIKLWLPGYQNSDSLAKSTLSAICIFAQESCLTDNTVKALASRQQIFGQGSTRMDFNQSKDDSDESKMKSSPP